MDKFQIEIKLANPNGTQGKVYAKLVNRLIRKRYSLSQELAIIRQRDDKPEEFAAYNAYAEECKAEAKAIVYGA